MYLQYINNHEHCYTDLFLTFWNTAANSCITWPIVLVGVNYCLCNTAIMDLESIDMIT